MGEKLEVHPKSIRNWVNCHDCYAGKRAGPTTDEGHRRKELEREDRELKRAKEFLRRA